MKPVIAPVSHVMGLSPSVCPVLMAITWRVECAVSTVPCGCTLRTMAPADAAPSTVTFAQMTGPVSVSYYPLRQQLKRKNFTSG